MLRRAPAGGRIVDFAGLAARKSGGKSRKPFKQQTFDLGQPAVNLDKALALAAALEDDETVRKLALRK